MTEKVDIQPIKRSFDATQVDESVKRVYLQLIEELLRVDERRVNVYGAPFLGGRELQAKAIKQDGFAVINRDNESLYYLYKAWKYRNRMRGLHLLRTYLQTLWKDGWTAEQMWQRKDKPYPTALETYEQAKQNIGNYYLTSRIYVGIDDVSELGQNLLKLLPSIRTTLAAKYVLNLYLLRSFENSKYTNGIWIIHGYFASGYVDLSGVVEETKYDGIQFNGLAIKNALELGGVVTIQGVAK